MPFKKWKAAIRIAAGMSFLLAGIFVASGASAASTPANGSQIASTSDVVQQMRQLLAKYSAKPKFSPPGPPLDASKLKGKTIALVLVDARIGAINDVADAIKAAASLVGLKTVVFDSKSSPVRMQQGFKEAILNKADAIVNIGNVVEIIAGQIKEAKEKGIPTVEVTNSPPIVGVAGQGSDPNTFGNVSPDTRLAGKLMAASAIVNTDGHANVVIMNTSEVTASSVLVDGMKTAMSRCTTCSIVRVTDTPLSEWTTAITGLTTTIVRSHPEVNYLLPIYSDMGIFAAAGVQQTTATHKVGIASFSGVPASQSLIKNGDVYRANVTEDLDWEGWAVVDQAMRGMLKMKPANPIAPIRYVEKRDLQGVDTSSASSISAALFGTEYKDGFMKLWNVK